MTWEHIQVSLSVIFINNFSLSDYFQSMSIWVLQYRYHFHLKTSWIRQRLDSIKYLDFYECGVVGEEFIFIINFDLHQISYFLTSFSLINFYKFNDKIYIYKYEYKLLKYFWVDKIFNFFIVYNQLKSVQNYL